jgi:succinate dehydrogenase (ubiquinone) cytochrome b560 subunit
VEKKLKGYNFDMSIFNRLATAAATPSQQANHDILVKQRLNRPVAPHLTIYRPQVTWYLSALNRITGCVLSGGFYAYGALYLIAPTLGWHVESSVLAASFAAWPAFLAITTKALVAFPFTFHCLNGLRHLTWDTASMITNKQVTTTGWAVVYASIASAIGLAFL